MIMSLRNVVAALGVMVLASTACADGAAAVTLSHGKAQRPTKPAVAKVQPIEPAVRRHRCVVGCG